MAQSAKEAERQLDEQASKIRELWQQLRMAEERTRTKVDAVRLKLELEGLRQLEEVRRQFEKECNWYRRQHAQKLALPALNQGL